ncbi:hypothetical protein [Afipia felis]
MNHDTANRIPHGNGAEFHTENSTRALASTRISRQRRSSKVSRKAYIEALSDVMLRRIRTIKRQRYPESRALRGMARYSRIE